MVAGLATHGSEIWSGHASREIDMVKTLKNFAGLGEMEEEDCRSMPHPRSKSFSQLVA